MEQIIPVLEEIGLTKSEIAVYLALLELGSSSTGKIVDKSRTTSSKIYEVLDKLIQKGLASYIMKGGIKYFEAAPPERILDYMQEKQKRIEIQAKSLDKIMPELKLKQSLAKQLTSAKLYEGMKGLHAAFYGALEKLKPEDEFLAMNIPKQSETLDRFFLKLLKHSSNQGIKRKAIFNFDAKAQGERNNQIKGVEVKYSSDTTPASINILGDTVIIFPSDNTKILLFVIEDANTAKSFKNQFYKQWNQKVAVFEGVEEVKKLYRMSLDFGDYLGLAEGAKIVKLLGHEFFVWWQNEKRRRNIHSKIIMGDSYQNHTTVTQAHAEFKFIPGFENPGITQIFSDKLLTLNFGKIPIAFLTESKELADTNRTYFNLLWNQDVTVQKGFPAFKEVLHNLVDRKNRGETFDVLGAAIRQEDTLENESKSITKHKNESTNKYEQFFDEFTKYRKSKGVVPRLLFEQNSRKTVQKYPQNYQKPHVEVKFLPYQVESPVEIFIENDKTHLIIQEESKPTIITIANKRIAQAFQQQFDSLWNQDVQVYKGISAVRDIFDDMLEVGHCDFLGARGNMFDKDKTWVDEWCKRAAKKKFAMRNLTDPKAKGHAITTLPFTQTKYTLPKEFANLSVFWIYGNKIVISNWTKGEPTVVVMNNEQLHDLYKSQFDSLWNQTTHTFTTDDEIQAQLTDALNYPQTHWIGGNSGAENKTSSSMTNFFQEWMKKRVSLKKPMYDLVDYGSHLKGLEPHKASEHKKQFYHYKQLPKGLESPMVVVLFGEKVLQVFWGKQSHAILHENKEMFKSYMTYFNYYWKL